MSVNGVEITGMDRARLAAAVNFILADKDALESAGDALAWEDLVTLPDWYLWDDVLLNKLLLVTGTVFLLPTIRLWIEAKRIELVQTLIGRQAYNFIMQYTYTGVASVTDVDIGDLQSSMETAGASVILSCQDMKFHPWLKSRLPMAEGLLDKVVATELLNHSLFVMSQASVIEPSD